MKLMQSKMLNPQRVVRGDFSVSIEKAEYAFWCEPNGGNCVGVHQRKDGMVQIASTLTLDGDVQLFTVHEWEMLLANVREDVSYAGVLNVAANMFAKDELSSFTQGVCVGAFTLVSV